MTKCQFILAHKNKQYSGLVFSVGYIWFYWKEYEQKQTFLQIPGNENNYQGYKIAELYNTPKYANYKEEILNEIPRKQYHDLVIEKVKIYLGSLKVKSITANFLCDYDILHYGIKEGSPITMDHLISIILYTDFTEYSSKYSSTFRKLSFAESFESVKERNRAFFWQSKYFREAVEIYGKNFYDEPGPFFTGVNCILTMPEFAIRLCSPTSTSAQKGWNDNRT